MNTRLFCVLTIVFSTVCLFTKAEDEVWPIMRMASDENNLYLATEEHGLVIVDKETGKQTFFNEDNGKIRHNHLRDVQVNGNMLALAGGYTRDGYAIHFLWNDWVELLDLEAGSSVTIHVDENELSDCYAPKYQLSKWPLFTGITTGSTYRSSSKHRTFLHERTSRVSPLRLGIFYQKNK